jgi:adenylate cyclase
VVIARDNARMAREIERKFRVKRDRLPEQALRQGKRLWQGYLSYEPSVRVRLSEGSSKQSGAWITIKGAGTLSRDEFEYEIPIEDARALLTLAKSSLKKVRYVIREGSHDWEVDEFEGPHSGLWLAEVELDSEDEAFERPDWVGDEVTNDPRYANSALARAGTAPTK